ncbi:hypothetical protein [Dietzia cinnamea]|uniref:hypothetical protein n=1 Tax=Dietzia cinnamea TaxID=321318 RepID=UPI000774E386|nr:hypothetical protein [Dietzia cinnamea]
MRLRRFERLLREDLLLFASAALLFLAVAQFGISLAAASPEDGLPPAALVAMLVPAAGLIAAIARLGGAGGRYSKQPDLN